MYFVRIGTWVRILIWWELGPQMLHGVVILCARIVIMPPVGDWRRENLCQADFHRPILDVNFENNVWDGKNQRGIILFLAKQYRMESFIVIYYHAEPAVQFWGQTAVRTFFSDKYLCVHICIS